MNGLISTAILPIFKSGLTCRAYTGPPKLYPNYWPYLKNVILGFIDEGIVPYLFAEGGYTTRLHIIKDLPPGKVIWHFDQTDMALTKQTVGQTACIMGNIPTSLMITGTTEQVKTRCRELIETAGPGGGYFLAPGASADQAKIENIKAVLEAAREYGIYFQLTYSHRVDRILLS